MCNTEPSNRLKVHSITDCDLEAIHSFIERICKVTNRKIRSENWHACQFLVRMLHLLQFQICKKTTHLWLQMHLKKIEYKRRLKFSSIKQLGIFHITKDQHRDGKCKEGKNNRVSLW